MDNQNQISTYYITARELIKQNNPRAARSYILKILNSAVESYYSPNISIVSKIKTRAFMDKWIAVSRDLFDNGITDYVLECFGLTVNNESAISGVPSQQQPDATTDTEKKDTTKPPCEEEVVDIAGIIDNAERSQGWCADIYSANIKAVAVISASTESIDANGTGFIISDKGYLLTNDHIVFDEQLGDFYPKVYMSLGNDKKKYQLDVLFSNKKADIALCKFDPNEVRDFSVVKRISNYSKLISGANCCVIGNAFGMGLAAIQGNIRIPKNDKGDLMYAVWSNPGDSGGPVFNIMGECIGINKSKTVAIKNITADGIANATPMDKIEEILNKWADANDIVF